jgi:hypothetical protein
MSTQSLLTPSIITKETLVILQNNLVAAGKVNRQFENKFVKIGSTLTIRKPNRFKVVKGDALQIQNIVEPSTSITINTNAQVAFQFSSEELTLTVEDFSERYLKPAAEAIANQIDYDVLTNYQSVYNQVGTPGTVPASFAALAAVGQRFDEYAVPQDGRTLILNPASYWSMATALIGYYVKSVAEPAFKGFLASIANFEIYEDQNIQSQTVGNYGGTPVVNGAGQIGSSLVTNGWSTSITGLLNVGDIFTIAGVYTVNPQNRQSTGSLQNFVVTATANSDSGGNSTIQISPAIVTSGAYQNVTASPANLAGITVRGTANTTYAQNLAFVKDAIGLVSVPIELPDGVDFKAREMVKNVSMRVVRQFDINNNVTPCRLDSLYGTTLFYGELAARLTA